MLDLRHFTHLPELAEIIAAIESETSGMVVVAGLDSHHAEDQAEDALLPGGRSAFFRIIVRRLIPDDPKQHVLVVGDAEDAMRLRPRNRRRQVSIVHPEEFRVTPMPGLRPALMVFDRLDDATVADATASASAGLRVVAQLDTVFRGRDVLRVLEEMGAPPDSLSAVRWILTTQRWAALCPVCRQEMDDSVLRSAIVHRFGPFGGPLYASPGCAACNNSGRQGEVTVFDAYHQHADGRTETALALERYVMGLVAGGVVSPYDLLDIEGNQLRRTYRLLSANARSLNHANAALQRKLWELEAAQRVLEQRNRVLMSLEGTSRALLSTIELRELALQICRNARELGGADRAILYCRCDPGALEVVAADGWEASRLPGYVDPEILETGTPGDATARPYPYWPPGIAYRTPDLEGAALKAGLWAPLVAQGENVGVLVVHSTRRSEFLPAEVAVLEAFAGQAALAVQRTRLIEQLRDKVTALEAAQAGLAAKERLERELELARQVQQSMLPRTFPAFTGYRFAATNAPAREVGGDLYDLFALENQRFGVAIADVSDKGMAAALYMALLRSLLLAEARREASPRLVLQQVNRLLREVGEPDMFVSVFYGVVDTATRARYARAGHDRPLLIRAGVVSELGGSGSLLGIFEPEALHLSEDEIALSPGDRLVLYTDGLTDVVSQEGDSYGLNRLKALMADHTSETPEAFTEAIFGALHGHCGDSEQFDDMTMLVVDIE